LVKIVDLFKKDIFTAGFVLTRRMYYYFMYLIYVPSNKVPSAIRVYVGAQGTGSEKTLVVDSVVVHPEYASSSDHNIALLRLKTELEYNEDVAPICLSHAPRSNSSLCFTTGYDGTGRYLTIVDIMHE